MALINLNQAFGKNNKLDVGKETLEFDIAAVLGRKVCPCPLSRPRWGGRGVS